MYRKGIRCKERSRILPKHIRKSVYGLFESMIGVVLDWHVVSVVHPICNGVPSCTY